MSTEKTLSVLYIKESGSSFNTNTEHFNTLFKSVDIANNKEEAMKFCYKNKYDIIIGDLSIRPENVSVLKELKEMQKGTRIFAMLSPKDANKLYVIAELGINAFELIPEQFELALEEIARFSMNG